MIGLDTNVLVRYLMQDDARQSAKATALMESLSAEKPGFVSLTALIELVWVLSSAYAYNRAEVAIVLDTLLRTAVLRIERSELAWRALKLFIVGSADFADCLIAISCTANGCISTMTFDRGAARGAGMTLIE